MSLNDVLDDTFVFSKSTDEFYNYRVRGRSFRPVCVSLLLFSWEMELSTGSSSFPMISLPSVT